MDEIEDKAIIHAIAIRVMHDEHKGILSSRAYHEKQMAWFWIGAAILMFATAHILRSFEIHNDFVVIPLLIVSFILGGVICRIVFEGQFVEDKSLDPDGLFGKSQCPNTYCKSCGQKSFN